MDPSSPATSQPKRWYLAPLKRSRLVPLLTIVTAIVAVLRIAVCFYEYDYGPHVPLPIALLDILPFVALGLALYSFCHRHQVPRVSIACSASLAALLAISLVESVRLPEAIATRLSAGKWGGSADFHLPEDNSAMNLMFTREGRVAIHLGSRRNTRIFEGAWHLHFRGLGTIPMVELPGFGQADHLKWDTLHIEGVIFDGKTNRIISARLTQYAIR